MCAQLGKSLERSKIFAPSCGHNILAPSLSFDSPGQPSVGVNVWLEVHLPTTFLCARRDSRGGDQAISLGTVFFVAMSVRGERVPLLYEPALGQFRSSSL